MVEEVSSPKTPLEYLLKYFKEGFVQEDWCGLHLSGETLDPCELDGSSFGVGWPKDKSLDLQAAQVICSVVTTDPGHTNQLSYIDQ